jgi:hypothetical protein
MAAVSDAMLQYQDIHAQHLHEADTRRALDGTDQKLHILLIFMGTGS